MASLRGCEAITIPKPSTPVDRLHFLTVIHTKRIRHASPIDPKNPGRGIKPNMGAAVGSSRVNEMGCKEQ
jgi:hypothetical protein